MHRLLGVLSHQAVCHYDQISCLTGRVWGQGGGRVTDGPLKVQRAGGQRQCLDLVQQKNNYIFLCIQEFACSSCTATECHSLQWVVWFKRRSGCTSHQHYSLHRRRTALNKVLDIKYNCYKPVWSGLQLWMVYPCAWYNFLYQQCSSVLLLAQCMLGYACRNSFR